jgi:hypothetical protein
VMACSYFLFSFLYIVSIGGRSIIGYFACAWCFFILHLLSFILGNFNLGLEVLLQHPCSLLGVCHCRSSFLPYGRRRLMSRIKFADRRLMSWCRIVQPSLYTCATCTWFFPLSFLFFYGFDNMSKTEFPKVPKFVYVSY